MFALTANAADRLKLKIDGAEEFMVGYTPLSNIDFTVAEPSFPQAKKLADGSSAYEIPNDGQIYIVLVGVDYQGCDNAQMNITLVFLPEEEMSITGSVDNSGFKYSIAGSPAYEEYSKHRAQTWGKYEKMLYEQQLACGYGISGDEEKEQRAKKLYDKMMEEQIDFVKQNPTHPLSAIYFTNILLGAEAERRAELYAMLGNELKNGPYKPLIDFYLEFAKKTAPECPVE